MIGQETHMPQPLPNPNGSVTITIDAGNGPLTLGTYHTYPDIPETDNGTGWTGFISIQVDGTEYGQLCITNDPDKGIGIELGAYEAAMDQWIPLPGILRKPTEENTPS